MPKVAGIDPTVPAPAHTAQPSADLPAAPGALIRDRLAGWVSDLTTLHELTERLARTGSLDGALKELLRAGAALVGARRGLVVFEPADRLGPATTLGLGLAHADLGHLETVPRRVSSYGGLLLDGTARNEPVAAPDLFGGTDVDPRQREVAVRLGYGASYAVPLIAGTGAGAGAGGGTGTGGTSSGRTGGVSGRLGAVVWLYDEPAEPVERQRHLVGLYARYASEHLARLLELERARTRVAAIAEELLPTRLPRIPGVRLAARHRTGPYGGGDWYDALPLPEGAVSLAVGSVSGSGPGAVAAMGRLRASLRAYAVMEGEDPVAVLSDLELLLRLTEPARTATALFAYAEPAQGKIVLAGAGHAPPLIVGDRRAEFVETSLSAPLGMLSCWEAPSVELWPGSGETVLLYTDGLLRRTGDPMDRAFARLHSAAASVPASVREDPGAVADHVLRTVLPGEHETGRGERAGTGAGAGKSEGAEDVVVLAARFD
ncbi:PP2C family protein-serine/threonine phosphatase [Streptomyces sp. GMY02]|uniref:PP2C family protein-serine/threonine phosphatase n=1 Tax=Streptomyces sp. GMY02 TaxID=1333528 RepID=UPI0020B87CC5|nr:PP2C family protein-serine/threonine phosphatase [Streptomyces sp. GMY02]